MARKISVEIVGNASSLERAFGRASSSAQRFSIGIGTLVKSAVVFDLVNKAIEGLTSTVHVGIAEFSEHARVVAQTNAAIKSTGDVSGVTGKHIEDLGLKLSNLSGIDDEVVQAGENVLLSFTNIRNSVGKHNDIFDQATKAVADYATRSGKDVPTAAILLGRALQDPATKLTALSRAGIVFTKTQIEMVRHVEATKGVIAAQKVVLEELTKRFGGAAAAAGRTLPGQLNVLRDRFKDLAGSIVGTFAPAFAKAVAGLTGFVRRLSEAHGVHAKLTIVWDGIETAGRHLLDLWRHELVAVKAGLARAAEVLATTDFGKVGHLVGAKVGRALRFVADEVGKVNWSDVGARIVSGLEGAVKLVIVALPGILEGIGRVIARVLISTGRLLLGAGKLLGTQLLHGIEAGLKDIGPVLEKLALELVLKIVKPLDISVFGIHLVPGLHTLVGKLENELSGLQATARKTADAVNAALGGGLPAGAGSRGGASPAGGRNTGPPAATPIATAPPGPGAAVQKGFTLPFRLLLARAEAGATASLADDLKVAKDIRAFILKVIPKLHGDKLIGAYQELGTVNQQLADAAKTAASFVVPVSLQAAQAKFEALGNDGGVNNVLRKLLATAKAALRSGRLGFQGQLDAWTEVKSINDQLRGFSVPLVLQVAAAKFTALGNDDQLRIILTKIRTAAQKALKLGRLGFQGQLDAWNAIASVNDQLKNLGGQQTKFVKASTKKLLAGLGLDPAQERAARARLSQLGPGGTVPQGTAGAPFGGRGDIVVHTHTYVDGRQIEPTVTHRQDKRKRRNPGQRRGQFAGA